MRPKKELIIDQEFKPEDIEKPKKRHFSGALSGKTFKL